MNHISWRLLSRQLVDPGTGGRFGPRANPSAHQPFKSSTVGSSHRGYTLVSSENAALAVAAFSPRRIGTKPDTLYARGHAQAFPWTPVVGARTECPDPPLACCYTRFGARRTSAAKVARIPRSITKPLSRPVNSGGRSGCTRRRRDVRAAHRSLRVRVPTLSTGPNVTVGVFFFFFFKIASLRKIVIDPIGIPYSDRFHLLSRTVTERPSDRHVCYIVVMNAYCPRVESVNYRCGE